MSSTSPQTRRVGATAMYATKVRDAMHPGIMASTPTATLAEVARPARADGCDRAARIRIMLTDAHSRNP